MKRFSETIAARWTGRHDASLVWVGEVTGKAILDLGCSFGWFEKAVLERGCRLAVGIDRDRRELPAAARAVPGACFIQAHLPELPFLDRRFDLVVMWEVLEHLQPGSEVLALAAVRSVLKDGGRLFLSAPKFDLRSTLTDPAWYFGHRHYTEKQLAVLLAQGGFRPVRIESAPGGSPVRIRSAGGFFEVLSMFLFYPCKWIGGIEVPEKAFLDRKRQEEYARPRGWCTHFVEAEKSPAQISAARAKKPDIWILSHTHRHRGERSSLSGPVRFLLEYFSPRAETIVLQEQPMPTSDDLIPTLEIYREGVLILRRRFPSRLLDWWLPRAPLPEKTYLRLKLRDLLSAFYFTALARRFSPRADLFIGVECLNALWGWGIKILGLARRTVYYLFDFSPRRYPSRLFNRIYLWLDRTATYAVDATWNISPAIEEARIKLGYHRGRMGRQITVPYGLERIAPEGRMVHPTPEIRLVYAGGINSVNGVMLLPLLVKSLAGRLPAVSLKVMGSGSGEEEFLREVERLGLGERISFLGYLSAEETWRVLEGCHLGLAPYYPAETTKMYGDVIKIKTYLSAGLPVITTAVPPISREVAKRPLGLVVPYDAARWAEAVERMVLDPDFFQLCRRNALAFVREQSWEKILNRAVQETMAPQREGRR